MKRNLFLLPLMALLFLAACSDSNDEVAKEFYCNSFFDS